jgi:NitT/TauT family transport system permease protein
MPPDGSTGYLAGQEMRRDVGLADAARSVGANANPDDDAAVEAGLDVLDTPTDAAVRSRLRAFLSVAAPPLIAIVVIVVIWQALWAMAIWDEIKLPAPASVWQAISELVTEGKLWEFLWVSLHRAVIGFLIALAVATPLGLVLAKVTIIRAAIGPLVSGLQSLPSVAWVPAAVIWFGLTDATIYTVVLLGAVPSIANGLIAGIDHIPPILPRVGKVLGADYWDCARHILLPAALPGFIAGMKQGWAFSWRSLMAAELIATSPQLGEGLGQYLHDGMALSDMPMVIAGIALIFCVGVGIELLVFRPLEKAVLRARGLSGAL